MLRRSCPVQGSRRSARNWKRETAAVNDTAVDLLTPPAGERIGEIGFGPGRTLARLAAAGADVLGVDASADMVAVAARRNVAHINAGRIQLHHGDGTLPTGDGTLDEMLSVHSLYFWPNPAVILAEIRRALRPGGQLVLAFRCGEHPRPARFDPTVYRVPTTTEAVGWLNDAGFTNVAVHRRPRPPPACGSPRPRRDHRGPSIMDHVAAGRYRPCDRVGPGGVGVRLLGGRPVEYTGHGV